MIECWKPIENYNNLYEISSFGNIRSLDRKITMKNKWGGCTTFIRKGKVLKNKKKSTGYNFVCLSKNNIKRYYHVHRLVAQAFIPNPNTLPQVNHKDGNKDNNNVNNLEWCTSHQNLLHASKMGLSSPKSNIRNSKKAKLTEEKVKWLRTHYKKYDKEFGISALSKKFNISRGHLSNVIKLKYWSDIDDA